MWWDFGDEKRAVSMSLILSIPMRSKMITCYIMQLTMKVGKQPHPLQSKCSSCLSGVDPDEIHVDLWWGDEEIREVTVKTQDRDLVCTVGVRLVGMRCIRRGRLAREGLMNMALLVDTGEPGMTIPNKDRRPIGTQVLLTMNGVVVDQAFEFPFYGQNKSQIAFALNGYLTFAVNRTHGPPHP